MAAAADGVAPAQPPKRRFNHGLLVLLLGLAAALAAAWWQRQDNLREVHAELHAQAERVVASVIEQLSRAATGLRGVRGYVLGAGLAQVDREGFHRYISSHQMGREFPGTSGFGLIRRVGADAAAEADFIADARRHGWPQFTVKTLAPHTGERLVIQYVEPDAPNRSAIGLDIASEPLRREAAERALASGLPAISAPLALVQPERGRPPGLLMLLPLTTDDSQPGAAPALVYAVIDLAELLRAAELRADRLTLTLDDTTDAVAPRHGFASPQTDDVLEAIAPVRLDHSVYGRRWQFTLRARPALASALRLPSPNAVWAVGSLITLLLAGLAQLRQTLQQRTLAALEERTRLASMLDHSADATIGLDLQGRIVLWSHAAAQLFGFRRDEAVGRTMDALGLVGPDPEQHRQIVQRALVGQATPPFETLRRHRDGSMMEIEVSAGPVLDDDARVVGVGEILRHSAERVAAVRRLQAYSRDLAAQVDERTAQLAAGQAALRQSELMLARAGELAQVGGWDLALRDGALRCSPQTCRILGLPDTPPPRLVDALARLAPSDAAALRAVVRRALRSGDDWDLELPLTRADGVAIWVRVIGACERSGAGAPAAATPRTRTRRLRDARLVGALQDITERRRADQRAREVAQAEAANRAKSEFLANTSHEIRTPLNAILGLTYILERAALPAPQRQMVAQIQHAGRTLLGLVNNVLDLSKIEAGLFQLEALPFDLRGLLQAEVALLSGGAEAKGLALTLHLANDVPARVVGDPTRLRQIIDNLLGNAIKFTDAGQVTLHVTRQGDAGRLRIAVRDTGPGIAKDVQTRLFQPFTQADSSTTRRYGGSGLGLSIVARLVRLMGGELSLTSSPGSGSEFAVVLPLPAATDDSAPTALDADAAEAQALTDASDGALSLPGVHVLVADDSLLNLDVARHVLELEGATVTACADGLQALALLQRAPGDFDVVLMDVQMPGIDGIDATRRLRRELGLDRLPVIALTAGVEFHARDQALAAGMTDFIGKPLQPQALVSCIRHHVERSRGAPLPVLPRPRRPNTAADAPPLAINGIDGAAVTPTLWADRTLFVSMLARFLAEFGSIDPIALAALPPDALAAWAHKLKGSALLLGALDIAGLATRLEPSPKATPGAPPTGALLAELNAQLAALNAASALELQRHSARAAAGAWQPLAVDQDEDHATIADQEAAALAELRALLRRQSLDAVALFDRLQPALQRRLGPANLANAQAAIAAFDFAGVLQLLEPVRE